ncbi:MAG: alpha-2-macroglobulin [Rhodospirillaceae bacterium]
MVRAAALLRLLGLILCAGLMLGATAPTASAQRLDLPGLDADAQRYAGTLRAKSPPAADQKVIDEALTLASQALAAKEMLKAVQAFERAIAARDDRAALWMALAQAQAELTPPSLSRALQAGWLGYTRAEPGKERVADGLWLAKLLDGPMNRPADALAAWRAVLGDAVEARLPLPEAEHRIAELRLTVGLTLKTVSVSADEYPARICLQFSDSLKTGRDLHYEDFVRLTPAVRLTAQASAKELCLSGFSHGASYQLTLREGLPGAEGLSLKKEETKRVQVPDRSPSVAFKGQSFLLARGDTGGVPVLTVNLDTVGIKVYRVNDRNLVTQFKEENLNQSLTSWRAQGLKANDGELVWEGRLAVKGERNKEAVTGLAVRTLIPQPRPGLYAVVAEPLDVPDDVKPWRKATQWLMISDLGLTTTRGADGIHVFARSLATAKPVAGIDIALLARNNAELGRAASDADGHVHFAAALTRGEGGQSPLLVTAGARDGDFAALDLTLAAFDLSDRGVGGRAAPGPLDVYLYSDRGVYRPGETVNLTALLRDDRTAAVDQFPLTLKVLRPSGTEYWSGTLKPAAAGGFTLPLALSRTAPLGGWSVQAYGDPKGEPIGKLSFQVEEFVPERLAVDLTAAQPLIEPGKPFAVGISARFLYGPPAAGLGGTAAVTLEEDPDPYPQYKGYRFGLAQEQVTARLTEPVPPVTDAEGKATLAVDLPPRPDTTKPLHAVIRVAISEPGGRPSRKAITVPVRTQPYALGIASRSGADRVEEGAPAAFQIIAVNPAGGRVARSGLHWELVAEHRDFQWYYESGRYKYRITERDQSVRAGSLAVPAAGPAVQELGALPWGRYRLEVSDVATGVASSYRFTSGWEAGPNLGDTPDTVEVSADRPAYKAGETARVHIQPPFAGEVLLTVATDRLHQTRSLAVPAGGTTVDVPVSADWGPGAYVTATVYRPPVRGKERLPVRAIGLVWLGLETADRTLAVTIDLPERVRPRQTLEVPVSATPGADAYVTLAAVDEGILQLTEFVSPDPGRHYFGKRALGLDIRDDYGRLIDTIDGPMGELRPGGDTGGLAGGLPKIPITVVSLFQGPVKLDSGGKALIKLEIPDFNGQLRLMAVAFDRTRVGSQSAKLIVRDPLVADASLPRFLAPGDDSRLTVSLHNVEAPAGRYRVSVLGQGPVRVTQPEGGTVVELAREQRQSLELPVTGDGAGIGGIVLTVAGPLEGPPAVAVRQELGITVRPSRPVESEFVIRQIPPGLETTLDAASLAGYVPGTGGLAASFSSGPPFDVAGLLAALDRYPYGCLEQLVSRALPLLAVGDVALALGVRHKADGGLDARVDQAISQVLDKQRFDGSFGLWSAYNEPSPWLTAYAMEFLTRARAAKHPVPDTPYLAGLTWLRQHAIEGGSEPASLASRAYALYTLAEAGVLTAGPVRYFADAFTTRLPTPLAKGQLGAALARLGDHDRAEVAFAAALSQLVREPGRDDYGSTVRDAAALVRLTTEAGMAGGGRLLALLDRMPASAAAVRETNTQEQAWLVLAAQTLMRGSATLALSRDGAPLGKGDPVRLIPGAAELGAGIKVRNAGSQPVWQAVTTFGVPQVAKPAAREGLKIKRFFFWRDGSAVNLDLVRQNDVFVVVLEGEAATKLFHQAIVSQPLAAGWELEAKSLGAGGVGELGWLKGLSEPVAAELRDDRYIAAINLSEEAPQFKLAFLVRAVTPGSYELPGARLEDMYKPHFFARQATGRITVLPAAP